MGAGWVYEQHGGWQKKTQDGIKGTMAAQAGTGVGPDKGLRGGQKANQAKNAPAGLQRGGAFLEAVASLLEGRSIRPGRRLGEWGACSSGATFVSQGALPVPQTLCDSSPFLTAYSQRCCEGWGDEGRGGEGSPLLLLRRNGCIRRPASCASLASIENRPGCTCSSPPMSITARCTEGR